MRSSGLNKTLMILMSPYILLVNSYFLSNGEIFTSLFWDITLLYQVKKDQTFITNGLVFIDL
jgi:hypothetical protein